MVDTIFTSLSFDLYTIVSNSLGLSFGLVAIDLVFNKNKEWNEQFIVYFHPCYLPKNPRNNFRGFLGK